MNLDDLILWLAILGFSKYIHPEKLPPGVFPELRTKGCNSFVVWEDQPNFSNDGKTHDTTIVDILFDDEEPYGNGRISFTADKAGEIESSHFTYLPTGMPFYYITQKITTIGELVAWIEDFKVEFINYQKTIFEESLNAE